jgi:hypothetical protein
MVRTGVTMDAVVAAADRCGPRRQMSTGPVVSTVTRAPIPTVLSYSANTCHYYHMASEVWVVIGSVASAVVVGAVALLGQQFNQRAEARRHRADIDEARRTERLTEVINYLKLIQQGELVAIDKYHDGKASPSLDLRVAEIREAIWVAQRVIELLCKKEVSNAAHDLSSVTDAVMKNGPSGKPVVSVIRPVRKVFIEVAQSQITFPQPLIRP